MPLDPAGPGSRARAAPRAHRLRLFVAAAVFGTALYSCESCAVLPAATGSAAGYAASAALGVASFFILRALWRRLHLGRSRAVKPMAWLGGMLGVLAAVSAFLATKEAFIPLCEPAADGISVADAPSHADAVLFTFRDAHVDPTRFGRAVDRVKLRECPDDETHCDSVVIVSPVVPYGWTPAEPVSAWAVKTWDNTDGTRHVYPPSAWSSGWSGGRRVSPNALTRLALADAAKHGLRSSPGAPVLVPSADPTAEAVQKVQSASEFSVALLGAWLLLLVLALGASPGAPRPDQIEIAQPWNAIIGLAVAPILTIAIWLLMSGQPGLVPCGVLSAIGIFVFWLVMRPVRIQFDAASNVLRVCRPRPWGSSVQRIPRADIERVDVRACGSGYYGARYLQVVLMKRGGDAVPIEAAIVEERDRLAATAGALRALLGQS